MQKEKRDNIYIYLWEEFNTIYIGRTIRPKSRHYQHRHIITDTTYKFSSEHHVEHPKMIIIENDLTVEEGIEREKYWIEYYRNETQYNVLNKTKGGETGTSGSTKWTKEAVFDEAKKYSTRAKLKYANNTVYYVARINGWLDELFGKEKNKKPIRKWTKEAVFEESKKYNTRHNFQVGNETAYKKALENGWLDEMTWLEVVGHFIKWTKEAVFEESKKYITRNSFHKGSPGAYYAARIKGWLNDMTWLVPDVKWTKEAVFDESKKYMSRGLFKKGAVSAYQLARKNGWLNEMTWLCKKNKKI